MGLTSPEQTTAISLNTITCVKSDEEERRLHSRVSRQPITSQRAFVYSSEGLPAGLVHRRCPPQSEFTIRNTAPSTRRLLPHNRGHTFGAGCGSWCHRCEVEGGKKTGLTRNSLKVPQWTQRSRGQEASISQRHTQHMVFVGVFDLDLS